MFRFDDEFASEKIKSWLRTKSIKWEGSAPNVHNQMGVVERANQTIRVGVNSLLVDRVLPHSFFLLASKHFMQLNSRLPSNSNEKNISPYEIYHGQMAEDLDRYCSIPFGTRAFVHTPKVRRSNTEYPATEGIFVGWSDTSKAAIIWKPSLTKAG